MATKEDYKKEELAESTEDEVKESPEEQKKESEEGSEAVKVPEEFQKRVYDVVYDATKEQISYIQSCCSERMSQLYKEEKPEEFDDKGMPPD